jgi:hypothetical protein
LKNKKEKKRIPKYEISGRYLGNTGGGTDMHICESVCMIGVIMQGMGTGWGQQNNVGYSSELGRVGEEIADTLRLWKEKEKSGLR